MSQDNPMEPNPDDPFDPVAGAISDGERVDWDRIESLRGLDRGSLCALKDVERIADFNRKIQRPVQSLETPTETLAADTAGHWGDLTLLHRIGAGAVGEVWRAWDPTLQRHVALKFIQDRGPGGAKGTELIREARALARIRHPGVVVVHGVAEHNSSVGMWMECLEGATLEREIERIGALPWREIARIGLELCSALEALESAGVAHRDIKPSNIILEQGGRIVLTDFGLGLSTTLDETWAHPVAGTPIFMAPELFAGMRPGPRSDLYALGVTLWWGLAGRAPFRAQNVNELKREAARGPAESLEVVRPDAPIPLVEAIRWSMRVDPEQRPASASSLGARLRSILDTPGSASQHIASIAVLPFANHSAHQDDEYFADGLADELLNVLGKIKGLRVTARSSAFSFQARRATAAEIGRALDVDTLLEGSVRKAGNRIRVLVQLVNVSDSSNLWSEKYDRLLDDLFAVQDDIAQSVVKSLRATLLSEESESDTTGQARADVARAVKGRGGNPEAHRLFLKGRYFLDRSSREDVDRGINLLKEATALEADFALAWAELARAYVTQEANGWGVGGYEIGREAAKRALSLEPDLAEGHAVIGWIHLVHDWSWSDAERSIRLALRLAPGNATVLRRGAVLAWIQARLDEAIDLNERAIGQDPLAPLPYINLGTALHAAGRLKDAEEAYRKAIELAHDRAFTRSALALVLLSQGRTQDALAEANREPQEQNRLYSLAMIEDAAGDSAGADVALETLKEKYPDAAPFEIAEVCALRGRSDEAFAWLERAFKVRATMICDLKVSRRLRSLHGDPRWKGLMERMGLSV